MQQKSLATQGAKHTKMSELFNRYIWLVSTISNAGSEGITLQQINEKWVRNSMSEGVEIPQRTFHNHKNAVQELFGLNIACNPTTHQYYISNADEFKHEELRTWLLNTFAVNHLINESHDLKRRILFERIPSGQRYLSTVIGAMRDGKELEMSYQSFGRSEPTTYHVQPYCVKVFKQRWYMVGKSDKVRIYSLDRIVGLSITDIDFILPKDFDPQSYFADCYGVIHDDELSSQTIRIKISAWQANYLRTLELHHSQQEVERNDHYSIFELYLAPTFDFCQELLRLGSDLEVLSPQSLRNDIAKIVTTMYKKYLR